MENLCRVSHDELSHDLEQAAQSQLNAEMFENLDVQLCEECSDQFPATEFKHQGICEGCAEWGSYPNDHQFVSESGEVYEI